MCRHLGYLGPPVTLSELVLRPEHSLMEQAWAPRDTRGGATINADGFGVGWYPDHAGVPKAYRSRSPIWTDTGFAEVATEISSGAILAAVRSATPGMPVLETACAPFTEDRWLFSHNGVVRGWPRSLAKVASTLDTADLMSLEAPTDSVVVWALVRQRLREGRPAAEAVVEVLHEVVRAAPESRMNLLLTDGHVLVATTWTHSLSVCTGHGAVTVASEPFGDAASWEDIPDQHLVVAEPGDVTVTALSEAGAP